MPRVAVITGGAGGIGSACAASLAADGFAVALVDRDEENVAAVAETLRIDGVHAVGYVADATDADRMAGVMAAIAEELGPVSVAVSAVAHEEQVDALDLTRSQLSMALERTVVGALDYWQLAVAQMLTRSGGGRIIVIGSLHSELPIPHAAAYNAAQAALKGLALSFAHDLVPHRITVNIVEPGWIDTLGERRWYSAEQLAAAAAAHPWGRLGTPQDVAAAVAYLASPGAEYVTGSIVRVDGGLSLSMARLPGVGK